MIKAIPHAREYLKLGCIFFVLYTIVLSVIIILIATGVLAHVSAAHLIAVIVIIHALPISTCILAIPHLINVMNRAKHSDGVYADLSEIQQV